MLKMSYTARLGPSLDLVFKRKRNVKSFPSLTTHRVAQIFVS